MQTLSWTKSAQYSWYSYLVFVLTKTRNEPKQPETSQNEPKPAETKPKGADFKFDILSRNFWAQTSKFGRFGPKGINFLILTKFCLHRISKVLISNQTFVFKNFNSKSPIFGVLGQKNQLSYLNEITFTLIRW